MSFLFSREAQVTPNTYLLNAKENIILSLKYFNFNFNILIWDFNF